MTSISFLTAPLVQANSASGRVGLAPGWEDTLRKGRREGIDLEPSLIVGPELGRDQPGRAAKLAHTEITASGSAGRVGGQHSALDDRRRLEGQVDLLGGVSIFGLEVGIAAGRNGGRGPKGDVEPTADAGEGEPALGIGGDGLWPGSRRAGNVPQRRGLRMSIRPPASGEDRCKRCLADFNPSGRLTVDVDQPAPDDLFGPEADLCCGLLGIRMELTQPKPEPGPAAPARA